MESNVEQLLESLKKADIVTYFILKDYSSKNYFGSFEMKQSDIAHKRLYSLFLKIIDRESAKRLKALDKLIEETCKKIEGNTGWYVSETGAVMTDNYQNMEDPEFRSWDTYTISRDEMSGFYVPDENKDFNGYFANIYEVSSNFLNKHEKEFEELHRLVYEKTSILRGNYSYGANSTDMELPRLISDYLGYTPSVQNYTR